MDLEQEQEQEQEVTPDAWVEWRGRSAARFYISVTRLTIYCSTVHSNLMVHNIVKWKCDPAVLYYLHTHLWLR
jgi:hypothetical protein